MSRSERHVTTTRHADTDRTRGEKVKYVTRRVDWSIFLALETSPGLVHPGATEKRRDNSAGPTLRSRLCFFLSRETNCTTVLAVGSDRAARIMTDNDNAAIFNPTNRASDFFV